MARKSNQTKAHITNCAYELFNSQGFQNTSIEQIVNAAGCSVGTFYHHFNSKESLLVAWVETYDEKYQEWYDQVDPDLHTLEKLNELNELAFEMMELRGDVDITAIVYTHMLQFRRDFSKNDRVYYRLLYNLLRDGQQKGEIRKDISYIELGKMYFAMLRGVVYEWCLASGSYSLKEFGIKLIHLASISFAADKQPED